MNAIEESEVSAILLCLCTETIERRKKWKAKNLLEQPNTYRLIPADLTIIQKAKLINIVRKK